MKEVKNKERKRIEEQIIKNQQQEKQLAGWFAEYSLNDKCRQKDDLEKYIHSSGYFDFYPEAKKKEFIHKTKFPCNLQEPHRVLFQEFLGNTKKQ